MTASVRPGSSTWRDEAPMPKRQLDDRPRNHGGIGYATNQRCLKAEESEGSRGGVGSGRNLCVAGGRRVSGKRGAVATDCTERRNYAQRGKNGRCPLGDILHLRKGGGTPSRYSTCGRRLHGVRRLRRRLWMRVRRCHSMLGILLQGHSGGAVIFRQACARRLEVVEVEEAKITLLDSRIRRGRRLPASCRLWHSYFIESGDNHAYKPRKVVETRGGGVGALGSRTARIGARSRQHELRGSYGAAAPVGRRRL